MTIQVDFARVQAELERLLNQVEAGATVVICKDETPIAEIRPVEKVRPVGLAQGEVTILPTFFEPLPEEIIEGFEGKAG